VVPAAAVLGAGAALPVGQRLMTTASDTQLWAWWSVLRSASTTRMNAARAVKGWCQYRSMKIVAGEEALPHPVKEELGGAWGGHCHWLGSRSVLLRAAANSSGHASAAAFALVWVAAVALAAAVHALVGPAVVHGGVRGPAPVPVLEPELALALSLVLGPEQMGKRCATVVP